MGPAPGHCRTVADGTATLSPKVTTTLIESYVERRAAPAGPRRCSGWPPSPIASARCSSCWAAAGPTPSSPRASSSARRR
ncbi:hypothetical protein [Blastococcus brunescens]|uniref:Uncharacterized protein n=1 Tax=Blastococcus brunescens TaxID=1564165 RepID=A0ABZ1BAN5_9ACTN|nr:hypothetical protein [Blastococcus sp. BMG 8361]WRL67326.1 hypothetical protein U6N30_30930 [Blastococcus sp. BMG 8361]